MNKIIFYAISVFLIIGALTLISCKRSSPIPTDAATLAKSVGSQSESQLKKLHLKHEDAEVKCIACHHKEGNDDRIKKCSKCHDSEDDTAIESCIKCHQEKNKM